MVLQLSQKKKPDLRASVSRGLTRRALLLPRSDQGTVGIDRFPVRLIIAGRNFSITKASAKLAAQVLLLGAIRNAIGFKPESVDSGRALSCDVKIVGRQAK